MRQGDVDDGAVKHFERSDNARTLILCPAPLVEMWERYDERYQLNAKVVSMGMLRSVQLSPDGGPAMWI